MGRRRVVTGDKMECSMCCQTKVLISPDQYSSQYNCSHKMCKRCWRKSTQEVNSCPYCYEDVSLFLGKARLLRRRREAITDEQLQEISQRAAERVRDMLSELDDEDDPDVVCHEGTILVTHMASGDQFTICNGKISCSCGDRIHISEVNHHLYTEGHQVTDPTFIIAVE